LKGRLQKRVLKVTAAFAVGVVVAAVAVHRDELLVLYDLWRLRRDPSRFEEMLLGTPAQHEAAERFVEEPVGAKALFELLIAEIDRGQIELNNQDILVGMAERGATYGSFSIWQDGIGYQLLIKSSGSSTSWGARPTNPLRRERILALLDACEGRTFRHEAFVGFEFEIQPVVNGVPQPPRWAKDVSRRLPRPVTRKGSRHVCYFRVVPNILQQGE
jgi:hypothetical protein